jgi:hypothetical protein
MRKATTAIYEWPHISPKSYPYGFIAGKKGKDRLATRKIEKVTIVLF